MGVSISTGEVAALSCAFTWATTSLILRTQSYRVPPALMNAIRGAVAAVLFWVLLPFDAPLSDYGRVLPYEWWCLVGSVLIGMVIGDTLYVTAIREIGVSRTLALSGTYPLTTLLFEWLLLRHPVNRAFLLGCFLVVAGVVCLSARPRQTLERPVRLGFGIFLSLMASLLWGLGTVLTKPAIAHLTAVQANSIRMPLVAGVLYLVWSLDRRRVGLRKMGRRALLVVAFTGVVGVGIGSLLFLTAIARIGPAKTATITATAPVFGMVMATAFLKEAVTFRLTTGVLLCVAGVWLVL